MPLVSGGVPTRQRGAPKRPAVLGWVAAVFGRFLQFAVEPKIEPRYTNKRKLIFTIFKADGVLQA